MLSKGTSEAPHIAADASQSSPLAKNQVKCDEESDAKISWMNTDSFSKSGKMLSLVVCQTGCQHILRDVALTQAPIDTILRHRDRGSIPVRIRWSRYSMSESNPAQ